jgi:D-alanine-D-alanine ligase
MQVAILHNAVSAQATPDEQDVQVQLECVQAALARLGHPTDTLACTLNLAEIRDTLLQLRPQVAFNLVEALGGTDQLQFLVPALLDALHLRYTGSPTEAMFNTVHKVRAKQMLLARGLPTPGWLTAGDTSPPTAMEGAAGHAGDDITPPAAYIIKSTTEHASFGIDEAALVRGTPAEIRRAVQLREQALGRPCFAEAFVPGREFNLSLLAQQDHVQVLPVAEIDFSAFPEGKARIVGYGAKWDETTFEFHHTPRRFDFDRDDEPLLAELRRLAVECWKVFGLRGYARVDFRVDPQGRPWILEINVNPCLSPDAGFAAAVTRAGLAFESAVDRILRAALPK